MSLRVSLLALSLILFLMVLMSNVQSIAVKLLFVEVKLPVFMLIASATLFGVAVSFVFISVGAYENRLRKKQEAIKKKPIAKKKKS